MRKVNPSEFACLTTLDSLNNTSLLNHYKLLNQFHWDTVCTRPYCSYKAELILASLVSSVDNGTATLPVSRQC